MRHATKRTTPIGGMRMSSLALDILHTVYAGPDAAKRIAQDLGISHRTTENWWTRRKGLRADVFLRLAQSNAAMREELLRRLGGHGYVDVASGGGLDAAEAGGSSRAAGRLDRSAPKADQADAVSVKP